MISTISRNSGQSWFPIRSISSCNKETRIKDWWLKTWTSWTNQVSRVDQEGTDGHHSDFHHHNDFHHGDQVVLEDPLDQMDRALQVDRVDQVGLVDRVYDAEEQSKS